MTIQTADDIHLNTEEAARFLGVSRATLVSWRHRRDDGGPPSYQLSPTHYVYRRSELLAWLEQFRRETSVKIVPLKPGQAPRPWES